MLLVFSVAHYSIFAYVMTGVATATCCAWLTEGSDATDSESVSGLPSMVPKALRFYLRAHCIVRGMFVNTDTPFYSSISNNSVF